MSPKGENNVAMFKSKTINAGMNAKTVKGDKMGEFATAILYLAPADTVAGINLCPMAKLAGCKSACLYSAGRGAFNSVQQARINKTVWFRDDRAAFIAQLDADIKRFVKWCGKHGVKAAVRLNGTSDIQWEVIAPALFTGNPDVMFYDYTKIAKRAYRTLPVNYHLTLSYSEANETYAAGIIKAGRDTNTSVAVVYRNPSVAAERIASNPAGIHNGDKTDLRFLDPRGVIVALYAKGPAKRDTTGFVVG